MNTKRNKWLAYLLVVTLMVTMLAAPVYAKTSWSLEGWRKSASTWIKGNLFTWREGDLVPYRLVARTFTRDGEDINVQHDYLDAAGHYGIDGTTGWFIGPVVADNVPIGSITPYYTPSVTTFSVSEPAIVQDGQAKVLEYTITANSSDFLSDLEQKGSWALYWYAHLSKTGTPNFSFPSDTVIEGSSYWTGASMHTHTSMTGNQDVPIKTPPMTGTPAIMVEKTADPTSVVEPGGNVTFTVTVYNTGDVSLSLTSLVDSIYGNLSGKGSISLPQTIAVNGQYTGTFTGLVSGDAGTVHTNVVTASATGDGQTVTASDDAVVTITDAKPAITVTKVASPLTLPEPGGLFTYTYVVTNNSVEIVTITSVRDNVIGAITLPTVLILAPGASSAPMTGTWTYTEKGVHGNTVTAKAIDNEGNEATATATASVEVTDIKPSISVSKVASPLTLPEPGGLFTYTYIVTNNSIETVTITSVNDNVIGAITLPTVLILAPGASSAAMTGAWTYTEKGVYGNTVTAKAIDNDGNEATATASASVEVTDIKPSISVSKVASPLTLPEPGGLFTYTYIVTNNSIETVTITSVHDDVIGSITLPTTLTLAPGASSAPMTGTWTYTEKGVYGNTVTAKAVDNEGNEATATATASVEVTDIKPSISVSKVASPLTLPEPGGLFTYTYIVTNNSIETVTITSVNDNVIGAITLPTVLILAPGASSAAMTGTWTYTEKGVYGNTVTAKAIDNDGNEATATASASVEVTDVPPVVDLDKSVDTNSLPEPGGVFTFTLTITNNGVEAFSITSLTDTNLTAPYPVEVEALIGQTLQPGASVTASYPITHTAIGSYDNTATVLVTDNEGSTDSDSDTETVVVTLVPRPSLTIAKTVKNLTQAGPFDDLADLEEGDTALYRVIVTNNGNVTLNNVMLHDDQVAPGTAVTIEGVGPATFDSESKINLGTMTPGASLTITYEYVTTVADVDEIIINTATASTILGDEEELSVMDDATINVTAIPLASFGITITKKVVNQTAGGILAEMATGFVGDTFTYVTTITNIGDSLLSDVVLTDDKARIGGLVIRNSDNAELTWADIGGEAGLVIGELQAGASMGFTYRYTAVAADEGEVIINVATINAVFKPESEYYEDVPLMKEAEATITIHENPPQTGESGNSGTAIGLAMILAGIVALILRRRHRRNQMGT